ncbi:MAG: hypothetical protein QW429_02490 [Thermoprotei archaeon]
MDSVSVSVPIPLVGDPNLFQTEPFIIVAGKTFNFALSLNKNLSLYDFYVSIAEKNKILESNLSVEQRECLHLAAALKIKYGNGLSSSFISKELRPILRKRWQLLLPLVYSSYTNCCVAAKKSEDPVIIFKQRFPKLRYDRLELAELKRTHLSNYVMDVVNHAVGRLSVEAAEALRKRNTDNLAAILNCFSGLLFSILEWDENLFKINRRLMFTFKSGYKGCAYIPSWKLLVKL